MDTVLPPFGRAKVELVKAVVDLLGGVKGGCPELAPEVLGAPSAAARGLSTVDLNGALGAYAAEAGRLRGGRCPA
jgi:hypothetical protein